VHTQIPIRRRPAPPDSILADPPMTAKQAAAMVGITVSAFWRAVGAERLPAPVYPLPKAPRWFGSELRAALDATRAMPRDQMAARRTALLKRRAAQKQAA
jgi:predicted DNA-binding transcriptional regulator AlpA